MFNFAKIRGLDTSLSAANFEKGKLRRELLAKEEEGRCVWKLHEKVDLLNAIKVCSNFFYLLHFQMNVCNLLM